MKRALTVLSYFLVPVCLWGISGETITVTDDSFPNYACLLNTTAKVVKNGEIKKEISSPCTGVVIAREGSLIEVLTAAHCVVSMDINKDGSKVFYHSASPQKLVCPEVNVTNKKIVYTTYPIQKYDVYYDTRYLSKKALLLGLLYYQDVQKTKEISLVNIASGSSSMLESIKVDDPTYYYISAQVAALDLALITINTDQEYKTLKPANRPQYVKKGSGYGLCRIAGYSDDNNELTIGETTSLKVAKADMEGDSRYISTKKKGQKSWLTFGDSGGPLICRSSNEAWEVVGVASNVDYVGEPTLYWSIVDQDTVNKLRNNRTSK